jgi:hypothetical protein
MGPVLTPVAASQAVSAIGIDRLHLRATSQQWLGTGSHWGEVAQRIDVLNIRCSCCERQGRLNVLQCCHGKVRLP